MEIALKKQLKKTNSDKTSEGSSNSKKTKLGWVDEYRCMTTGDIKVASGMLMGRLGKELKEWAAKNEDAFRICEFFADNGINRTTYESWLKRDDNFREDYYHALRYIGRRREKLASYRKYNCDTGFLKSTMHHFMDEFKHDEEWRAGMRQKDSEDSGTKYVVIETVQSSDKVKPAPEILDV